MLEMDVVAIGHVVVKKDDVNLAGMTSVGNDLPDRETFDLFATVPSCLDRGVPKVGASECAEATNITCVVRCQDNMAAVREGTTLHIAVELTGEYPHRVRVGTAEIQVEIRERLRAGRP